MTTTERAIPTQEAQANFYVLRQDGVLGIRPEMGKLSRPEWQATTKTNREKVKAKWDRTKQLLGINMLTSGEVSRLLTDPQARDEATRNAYVLYGNAYKIEGGPEAVPSKFREYAERANNTISESIRRSQIGGSNIRFEQANEVQAKDNPVELALLMLNPRNAARVRFEAKRKLELMDLAARIDHRERRETRTREHYNGFAEFLDDNVWDPNAKIGEAEYAYLLSKHDPDTNASVNVNVLSEDEGASLDLQPNERLTLITRRRFIAPNGKAIPIYFTPREKPIEAKILKLLRKGAENPAIAVDDEIGFTGVLDSIEDLNLFKRSLMRGGDKAGSAVLLEEIEDTLTSGAHIPASTGSSSEVRMFKCFVMIGGTRIEMILHTNQTFIDSKHKEGVAHDEYEVKRLFDSGVMELLFPTDIYGYDAEELRQSSMENVRRIIRA